VRESRTPGSVRGERGDPFPYRDVRQAKLAWSSRWKSGEGKAVARRPVASVAWTSVTAVAKRTQQSCGVGY
jgi:hypothetical protein